MLKDAIEVVKYRELLWNLVVRDIKVRYKNSVMGFIWSLLNPLLQVATITLVFKYFFPVKGHNFSAYLLCGILPWLFFQLSVLDSCVSVLIHARLVKKNYFPRELLPVSVVVSNFIHFLLAYAIFFVYILLYLHVPVLKTWVLLPVVMAIEFMLTMGVCFIVSAMNVFYEDIKYLATSLLNLMFYLTPILYPVEMAYYSDRVPAHYQPLVFKLMYLNPLSYIITAYKKIILEPYGYQDTLGNTMPDLPIGYDYMAIAAAISFVIMIAGYAYFNKKKWGFAERF